MSLWRCWIFKKIFDISSTHISRNKRQMMTQDVRQLHFSTAKNDGKRMISAFNIDSIVLWRLWEAWSVHLREQGMYEINESATKQLSSIVDMSLREWLLRYFIAMIQVDVLASSVCVTFFIRFPWSFEICNRKRLRWRTKFQFWAVYFYAFIIIMKAKFPQFKKLNTLPARPAGSLFLTFSYSIMLLFWRQHVEVVLCRLSYEKILTSWVPSICMKINRLESNC